VPHQTTPSLTRYTPLVGDVKIDIGTENAGGIREAATSAAAAAPVLDTARDFEAATEAGPPRDGLAHPAHLGQPPPGGATEWPRLIDITAACSGSGCVTTGNLAWHSCALGALRRPVDRPPARRMHMQGPWDWGPTLSQSLTSTDHRLSSHGSKRGLAADGGRVDERRTCAPTCVLRRRIHADKLRSHVPLVSAPAW